MINVEGLSDIRLSTFLFFRDKWKEKCYNALKKQSDEA